MRPVTLDPAHAFSAATIGRAWLRAMGIRPVLKRQADFPKNVLGYSMVAYYGGRAEARIRRVPVPVVYVDFLSQYSTVCTLLHLWSLLICETIEIEDATVEVQRLLGQVSVGQCLLPETWRAFAGLVQFIPQGDILPSRAPYGGASQLQIGVNPLWLDEAVWYTIPDAVASTLLSGRPPKIIRAIRFVPRGMSPVLRSVSLRGAVTIDPRQDDFFKVIIEERKGAATRVDLSGVERERLDRFLKVLANATSYGIFVEMRRRELRQGKHERVTVYGLDPTSFTAEVSAPEEPGEYTFPPLGALISGAARLMLTILERLVADTGGVHAFCDTDSMAIVASERGGLVPCPGGIRQMQDGRDAVQALSWADVEGIRSRFAALNPYDRSAVPGSILKLEDVNVDPVSGQQRQLYCFAISAKRYALWLLSRDGRPVLRDQRPGGTEVTIKHSEHALGHLLNPADPEDESRDWITTVWEGIITEAMGHAYPWPKWLDRPAASRLTVATWRQFQLFAALNRKKPYADQIKPANFLLSFPVAPFGHPTGVDPEQFHLFAPWNPDPRQWLKLTCFDFYSGQKYRITTRGQTGSEGVARAKTYSEILADYRVHPEPKSLGPDGRPCGRGTIGLLRRRLITGIYLDYVGKESNRLEDVQAGTVHRPDEVLTFITHPSRGPWPKLVLPVLCGAPVSVVARTTMCSTATVKRIRAGEKPSPRLAANLTRAAGEFARDRLEAWNQHAPLDDLAACYVYLGHRKLFR